MDYRIYKPDKKWIIGEIVKLSVLDSIVGYLFFRNILALVLLLPFGYFIWKKDINEAIKERKKVLSKEFKYMITSLSGNLNAGYSLERSFYKTYQDLQKSGIAYRYIIDEVKLIINGLECNNRVEGLLSDFAKRSDVADIKDFSELITVSKIYGGNILSVIRQTVSNLSGKYMVEDEIETIISAKKMEGKIMLVMPFLIIVYMNITNKGYMDVIYYTLPGKIVMAVGFMMIVAAAIAIDKIVDIEVE